MSKNTPNLSDHNMKYTVTVGIPVYNEEGNIAQLIQSVIHQKADSYSLEKMIIVSDGSTDKTEKIVNDLTRIFPVVSLMADGERKSKCFRLNQLYELNRSDILVTFDGDIALSDDKVIENMIECFKKNENIVLVAANDKSAKPSNIQQRVINAWYHIWENIRINYKKGNNIYNLHGNGTAIKREFASEVRYPVGITADQDYLYLSMVKRHKEFMYAKNAIILFHTPEFFNEFFSQSARFLTEKQVLYDLFGSWINAEYYIPKLFQIKEILLTFVQEPIFTVLAFMLYFTLITFMKNTDPLQSKGMWQQAKSTKRPFQI